MIRTAAASVARSAFAAGHTAGITRILTAAYMGQVPGVGWGAGSSCADGWAAFHLVEFEGSASIVRAQQSVRSGLPPNPNALLPGTNRPVLGTTWDPRVDHTSFMPAATLDMLAAGWTPTNAASPYGTLLCALPAPFSRFSAPGQPFALVIPSNCSLMDVFIYCQGAAIDIHSGIGLTNAIDLRIGSY